MTIDRSEAKSLDDSSSSNASTQFINKLVPFLYSTASNSGDRKYQEFIGREEADLISFLLKCINQHARSNINIETDLSDQAMDLESILLNYVSAKLNDGHLYFLNDTIMKIQCFACLCPV